MITLYDLPCNVPIKSASFNSWKARYSLNFKGVAYQTKGIEYLEMEPHFKEIGVPPSVIKPDGSPQYTVPAIYDDATGAKVSDSLKIAEYLDKAYPTEHPLIPPGTEVFHRAFVAAFMGAISPILPSLIPRIPSTLINPTSQEYFKTTRSRTFGVKDLNELLPVGDEAKASSFKKMEEALANVDGWLGPIGDKPFIGGTHPVFADFVMGAAFLCMMHVWGKESEEWRAMSSWHGGRWGKIVQDLREYETAV